MKEIVLLRKLRESSPFKVNKVEDNPDAFALRKEMGDCIQHLFHEKNLLIYGPRAIGKSSLGLQLQNMLTGDTRLLERCKIETRFPKYLCARIPCGENDGLNQLALNILYYLDRNYENKLKNIVSKNKKVSLGFNLGILKAGVETEINTAKYSPTTTAATLIDELTKALDIINNSGIYQGINIMIDELEYLSLDINFAHFIKNVYEIISTDKIKHISFILAGNTGIYNRLRNEDRSISRFIKTIKIPILRPMELEFILNWAEMHSSTPFVIDDKGKELIVSLSSGFPHIPHLLGEASFMVMENESRMTFKDIIIGIEEVLKSDKKEEYLNILKNEMSKDERELIISMAEFQAKQENTLPVKIPIEWIKEELGNKLTSGARTEIILNSLLKGEYIKKNRNGAYYIFTEELFRLFIKIARKEREKVLEIRYEQEEKARIAKIKEEKLLDDIRSGELNPDTELSEEEKKEIITKVRKDVVNSRYTTDWEEDDEYNLWE